MHKLPSFSAMVLVTGMAECIVRDSGNTTDRGFCVIKTQ